MSKHTPGPWTAEKVVGCFKPRYRIVPLGFEIHQRIDGSGTGKYPAGVIYSCEQAEVDAYLIAAAPELLVALKKLVAKVELMTSDVGLGEELAAIAKAEGRS